MNTQLNKWKKSKVTLVLLCAGVVICACSASKCKHEWTEVSCTSPEICVLCNETRGEATGHQWVDATCTKPKTCDICQETEGKPLGHDWIEASCTDPRSCNICGLTEGEPLGHDWKEADCTTPKTCRFCGATEGRPSHQWVEATCQSPQICLLCHETEGNVSSHIWEEATCTLSKTCTYCEMTEGEPLGHNWKEATCTEPQICERCSIVGSGPLGHTLDDMGKCSLCRMEIGKRLTIEEAKKGFKPQVNLKFKRLEVITDNEGEWYKPILDVYIEANPKSSVKDTYKFKDAMILVSIVIQGGDDKHSKLFDTKCWLDLNEYGNAVETGEWTPDLMFFREDDGRRAGQESYAYIEIIDTDGLMIPIE